MLSNFLSLSFTGSAHTHVQTAVVYYLHTAAAYSLYCSFYISVFTVYYASCASTSGNETNIIAAACSAAAAAAAAVAVLFAVVLIRIRRIWQASEEQESDNVEQNDFETTNSFTGGMPVSNIEEDPFADDFKEDKFIDKI